MPTLWLDLLLIRMIYWWLWLFSSCFCVDSMDGCLCHPRIAALVFILFIHIIIMDSIEFRFVWTIVNFPDIWRISAQSRVEKNQLTICFYWTELRWFNTHFRHINTNERTKTLMCSVFNATVLHRQSVIRSVAFRTVHYSRNCSYHFAGFVLLLSIVLLDK